MSYYSLEQTLEVLQKIQPNTLLPFSSQQLADLCRRGELTPVFAFDKYTILGNEDYHHGFTYIKELTTPFNGYLTSPDLSKLLSGRASQVVISSADIYEEIGKKDNENKGRNVCLERYKYDHQDSENHIINYTSGDAHYIVINDLLFPIDEIQSYISAKQPLEKKPVKVSKAPPPPNHIQSGSGFKQRTIGDLIKAKQHESAISPNDCQRITMLYDYFTPHQAGCLIAGLHPAFNGSDDGLEIALGVIKGGIKKGGLILDDDGQLNSDDLKLFLYSKDWVMTGFNDKLASDTSGLDKDNAAYQKRVSELEKQLADAQAEIAKLNRQLKERPVAIDEDLKDVPHQSYRTVDRIMYAMAKLSELSNTEPYSQNNPSLNASIATILQNDGLMLEYQAIGKWLSRVKNVQPMK